jgi:type I restriction enzyme S subunit
MTRLSEVAAVESGSGFPIADQGVSDAEFPFLKVSDMNLIGNETEIRSWNHTITEVVRQRLKAKAFPAGAVIFPKIGAAIATNKKRLLTCPSCIDNNCMGVTADTGKLDPWYLYYLFRAKNLSDFASDSNPPSIRKTEVESWDIAVPPLDSQRRVVDQLSRAENIVRMRREAEQRAKEIIPALFLDMFGDPGTNPKGWRTTTLGEVVADGPQNGLYKHADTYGSGTPILRIDGFYDGRVRPLAEWKRLRLDETEARRFRLTEGDIVINRVNSPEYLGKSAIIPVLEEPAVYESNMMRVSMRREHANPEFVIAYLQTAFARSALIKNAKHAINQSSINQGDVKSVLMYLPPISEQNVFRARAADGRSLEYQQGRATEQAKQTFQALLAGVFSVRRAT